MKTAIFRKFLLLLVVFSANFLFAQVQEVRFEPDSRITQEISEMEEIDANNFAYIALVASGASEEKIEEHLETLKSSAQKFALGLEKNLSNEEKADKALGFIYEKFLKRYRFEQTRIDTAMETGVYNCVSSDIIFMYFAKVLDIPVVAVETPRHAFCTIESDGQIIDVETTNPYGVNPGKKRTSTTSKGRTQYLTVPANDYKGRHDVDDRRILAIVYNNRIAALQKQKKNAETIGLAVDANALQANAPIGVQTVSECVCNYAADLTAKNRDQEGLELVMLAQGLFGETKNFSNYIDVGTFNILSNKIDSLSFEDALEELSSKKEILAPKNHDTLLGYIYCIQAQKLGKEQNWKDAIQIAQDGLELVPADVNLKRLIRIFRQNYAIEFHNRAAEIYNSGDKEGAREILREGLKTIPESAVLKKDLSTMK